ncbi:hypothetical protein KF728_05725 [Candidatus Obscuribacterales bacterium]|nr:hypothetical protein [Candidatus Obscuribacterales bacterium]MBX3149641.1 hypothetical protein [Candidatus Obscuribacterales bacterium]
MRTQKRIALVLSLAVAVCFSHSASARTIEGGVSLDVFNEADKAPVRPSWIQGNVFSNDDMVLYSYYRVPPLKKKWRWEIPKKGYTNFKLTPTIVQHWKGWKPDGECAVTVEPIGKGKFRFHSVREDGPRGYLERIGENDKGFPRYRFWFEDSDNAEPEETTKSSEPTTGSGTSESAKETRD